MLKKLGILLLLATSASAQVNVARMLSGVNYQTGVTYLFVPADSTRVTQFNNANPVAVTLTAGTATGFGAGTEFSVRDFGLGIVTITCVGCTINGASTLVLTTGLSVDIYSDGLNYVANQGGGGGGGNSAWSSLTAPVGNLSLNVGTFQTVMTIGDYGSSPFNGVFTFNDTATSANDTSTNVSIDTGPSSKHNSFRTGIQGINQFQTCWQPGPQGEIVIGSAFNCPQVGQNPFAKTVIMSSGAPHTILRLYQSNTAATGTMQEWNNSSAAASTFFFFKACSAANGGDSTCGATGSIVSSLDGTGLFTAQNLTIQGVTGTTQCLQANTLGVVSGTGTPCATGGGGTPGGSQFDIQTNSGSSTFSAISNHSALTGQLIFANNAAAAAAADAGVVNNVISGATDTIPCNTATVSVGTGSARATSRQYTSAAAVAVTVPDVSTAACANLFMKLEVTGAGTVTFNRSGTNTFTCLTGSSAPAGSTSCALTTGQHAYLHSGDNSTYWLFDETTGSGATGATAPNLGAWYLQRGSCGTMTNCTQIHGDGRYVIDATSNSTTTITCPNSDCNFTAGDVGKVIWGTTQGTGPGLGFLTFTTTVCPVTTIATFVSAQSVTLNTACTANGTGNVALYWATDDGASLAALDATVGCSVVYLPDGGVAGNYILDSQPFLVTPPTTATCNQNITSSTGAPAPALVGTGWGASQSQIMISPSFAWANCKAVTGASQNVCIGGTARTLANIQILGSGLTSASNANCANGTNKILVSASPVSSTMYGVDVAGVCPGESGLIGVELNSTDENFDLGGVQEVGTIACNAHAASSITVRESDCHDALVAASTGLRVEAGAQVIDIGSFPLASVNVLGSLNSRGTHFVGITGAATPALTVGATGIWFSVGDYVGVNVINVNPTTALSIASGGFGQVANTQFGGASNAISNSGTFVSVGGNKVGHAMIGTGVWEGQGVMLGTCRGTATSSSTLVLYQMGTFGSTACSTAFSTAAATVGYPVSTVPLSGSVLTLSVRAGTGCASGNTCVFTVLKNGAATTITCSLTGGASTCQDAAHFDVPVAGDTYAVQFTTGAAETLANVTATLLAF